MKKVIAHRGAPTLAHENTIQSFSIAVDQGADIIEFDVRRTKDNILVAHHDPFTHYGSVKINISDLNFSDLQEITSKQNFQVPKIDQILQTFCGKTGFDIELKEEDCENEVLQILSGLPLKPECIFTSFNREFLYNLKQIDSSIKTGFLFESVTSIQESEINTDYLCPDYNTFFLNRDYFSCLAAKFSFAVWTVNTTEYLKKASADSLIEAVITNETALAIKIRNDFKAAK